MDGGASTQWPAAACSDIYRWAEVNRFSTLNSDASRVDRMMRRLSIARTGLVSKGLALAKGPGLGHVDIIDCFHVAGWCVPVHGHWPAVLEIAVDGKTVGHAVASRYRGDLESAGLLDGRVAFEFQFDGSVGLLERADVRVRRVDDGAVLPGVVAASDASFPLDLNAPVWVTSLDSVESLPGGMTQARVLVNAPRRPADLSVTGGELMKGSMEVDAERVSRHPGWRLARSTPYRITATIRPDGPVSWIAIPSEANAESLATRVPVTVDASWHTLAGELNYQRTCGAAATRMSQVATGFGTAMKVDEMIRRFGDLQGPARLLDWGTGAGRVAIPLKRVIRPDDEVIGVDVDEVNVRWCQENLDDIPVALSDIYPPLDLADDSVDVVFGVSVMTHLPQPSQVVWLRELRRIVRPGGLVLLTVHGDHAVIQRRISGRMAQDLRQFGISDTLRDPVISVREPGYYRGTFQTRAQVEATWGRELPIVAYLPMASGNFQDFVVMRKPDESTAPR
jgi:SAM-dependent methyltransferase